MSGRLHDEIGMCLHGDDVNCDGSPTLLDKLSLKVDRLKADVTRLNGVVQKRNLRIKELESQIHVMWEVLRDFANETETPFQDVIDSVYQSLKD